MAPKRKNVKSKILARTRSVRPMTAKYDIVWGGTKIEVSDTVVINF